jgi:hypothetical protein
MTDWRVMKVLDLQCPVGHVFEGWFASEEDFGAQNGRGQVQCPICGDPAVVKKLSAPRLNLSGRHDPPEASMDVVTSPSPDPLFAAWYAMARELVANTTDVGSHFPEEARKMHYGEKPHQAIRGKASPQEAQQLMDEGIEVVPFALPAGLKGPLQ